MSFSVFAVLLVTAHVAVAIDPDGVSSCLQQSGLPASLISLPSQPSFNESLLESLIQDPIATPQIYVRPTNTDDVSKIVKCAAQTRTVFCTRSGGHSWGSASSCPGIVIDLKLMTNNVYDNETMIVTVGAGQTIGQAVFWLHSRTGRIFPVGTCPTVGIGGYAQGGGLGILNDHLGLLSDNIVGIRGVKPSGDLFTATQSAETELFWALRGSGGGNFAIVTEFMIKTTEARGSFDNNAYFAHSWPAAQASSVMSAWVADQTQGSSPTTSVRLTFKITEGGLEATARGVCWKVSSTAECKWRLNLLNLWSVPDRAELFFEKSGSEGALEVFKFFGGDPPEGPGKPSGPATSPEFFGQRNTNKRRLETASWGSILLDPSVESASRRYFQRLIDVASSERKKAEMGGIIIKFAPLNGKTRLPDPTSAWPYRSARGIVLVLYNGGSRTERTRAKARVQRLLSWYQNGTYVNYMDVDLENYRAEYFGSSLRRLRKLKRDVDPKLLMWHPFPVTRNRAVPGFEPMEPGS